MVKVSVIIPAYNRAHCIGRAIASVRHQTFTDLEIIVIDDGSTDNTVEIVQAIPDERIQLLCLSENQGAGAARNLGLKVARGEYIAFLDSDDEWLLEKIERQVDLMDTLSEDWGVCHTGAYITKEDKTETIYQPCQKRQGNVVCDFMLGHLSILTPSVLLRAKCIETVGLFDERLLRIQDGELLFRVFMQYKLCVLPEPLIKVHLTTTKKFPNQVEAARLIIIEKHLATVHKEFGWFVAKKYYATQLWNIAVDKFQGKHYLSGLKYWIHSMAVMPCVSPKRYFKIVLIALGINKTLRTYVHAIKQRFGGQ